jgi:hypothetical protein
LRRTARKNPDFTAFSGEGNQLRTTLKLPGAILLLVIGFSGLTSQLSLAQDSPVGVWRLVSYTVEDPDSGQVFYPFGKEARGYLIYTAGGRMAAVLHAEGRKRFSAGNRINAPVEERAEAFSTSTAYTGTYTFLGDRVIHQVEVSTNPDWIGSEQVRYPKIEGNRLTIATPPLPTRPDGKLRVARLIWEREE